jgi:hypothetical protein
MIRSIYFALLSDLFNRIGQKATFDHIPPLRSLLAR